MPLFFGSSRPAVFYVHVPKTGGTHIEQLFQANGYRMTLWAPMPWGFVCSPQHFHRAIWQTFADPTGFPLSFVTVRHPADRLLSHYRDVQRLDDTCPSVDRWLDDVADQLTVDPFLHDNHLRPQTDFTHEDLLVVRQEDGFGPEWARALSEAHGLGFEVFDVESRRPPSEPTPLTASERRAVAEFCAHFYARDLAELGYGESWRDAPIRG